MITDYFLNFGLPDITNSTTKTASTNVYDAGSDVILFAAGQRPLVMWKTVITADASPTILIEMIASDALDLDANESPEATHNVYLGSSGIVRVALDGTVAVSGDTLEGSFNIGDQAVARQYYGLLVTLGGTNPDIVAATSYAYVVLSGQTNMRGARAAVPA